MLNYSIGNGYSARDAEVWGDRLDGFGVVSGLGVTPGTGLVVDVASGTALVGTADTVDLASSTSVSLDTADANDPRKDAIWIDDTGTVGKTTGVAEPADPAGNIRENTYQPEPPDPAGDVTILAVVWVAAGASSLATADIRDRRVNADIIANDLTLTGHTGEMTFVYLSTNQTVATSTIERIQYDTVSSGDLPGYDTTANEFVAPADGLYSVEVRFAWSVTTAFNGDRSQVDIRGAGTDVRVANSDMDVTKSGQFPQSIESTYRLAEGAVLYPTVYQTTGGNNDVIGDANYTWMRVSKVQ